MNWTARLLEDLRQWVLVGELGQVTCESTYHWLLDGPGMSCARCGAAV